MPKSSELSYDALVSLGLSFFFRAANVNHHD